MEKTQTLPISLSLVTTRVAFLVLAGLCFFLPFSLAGSQFITGAMVNAALFCSAVLLPRRYFFPLIFFPSLGVLSRGILFGPLTQFLLYFLPFIWLGNLSLVLVFKKTFPRFGFFPGVLISGLTKFLILFSFANLFFRIDLVPRLFLTVMGVNQAITAFLGGALAFAFLKKFRGKFKS